MAVVLGASVQVASADVLLQTPGVVVEDGNLSGALSGTYTGPIVVDSDASLSGTHTTKSRLDVREGTVTIGGTFSNEGGLQVSGNGATLNVTNGTVNVKGGLGTVQIGGCDGSGSLNLQNSTLDASVSLSAGFHKGADWAQYLTATRDSADASSSRYNDGSYVKVDYANREYGKATINLDNSTANFRSAIFLAEADMTLKNGSVVLSGSNVDPFAHTIEEKATGEYKDPTDEREINGYHILGRQSGSTTNVSIQSNSKMLLEGTLFVGSTGAAEIAANITVDGQGSTLETSQGIAFGYGHVSDTEAGGTSVTTVQLTNGGSMVSDTILFGVQVAESKGLHTVDVDVESAASITAKDIVISNGADVTVQGGSLAFSTLTMNGGALTLDDAAMLTINVTEAAGTAITLDGDAAKLDFAANTIKLVFDELLSVANPSVQLTWELISGIGENDDVNLDGLKILSGTDYVSLSNVKVEETDGKVVLTATASIPEPTTATLSLLALAALAARRRRK